MVPETLSDTRPEALPVPFVCRWAAALLLQPPDAAALAVYRRPEGARLLAALRSDPALGPAGRELSALIAPNARLDAAADRLATAHSRAFLVGGPRAAPPYASVWLSPRGLLWQEPARAMVRLLAETGVVVDAGTVEPPDHLGIQLNLLAVLLEREDHGVAVPLPATVFARGHMLTWLLALADALNRGRALFFYPDLVAGLDGYLRREVVERRQPRAQLAASATADPGSS